MKGRDEGPAQLDPQGERSSGGLCRPVRRFVAAFDGTGNLLGTTFFATSGNDVIDGPSTGLDGAAHVTGSSSGMLTLGGGLADDVFVAKIAAVPESAHALLSLSGAVFILFRRRRR